MMSFKAHSRRTMIALGAASGILLVSVAMFLVLGWVVLDQYSLALQRGEALDKRINDAVALSETRTTLLETESIRNRLSSYFIAEGNEVDFIEELESLGSQAGVSITFSSIEKITQDPPPELHISFSTEGLWQNMMHFTALLEALPRNLVIRSVSFSEISNTEGPSRWHGSFDIALKSFTQTSLQE